MRFSKKFEIFLSRAELPPRKLNRRNKKIRIKAKIMMDPAKSSEILLIIFDKIHKVTNAEIKTTMYHNSLVIG